MKNFKTYSQFINEGEDYIKGLHQAEAGDFIKIGFKGTQSNTLNVLKFD